MVNGENNDHRDRNVPGSSELCGGNILSIYLIYLREALKKTVNFADIVIKGGWLGL